MDDEVRDALKAAEAHATAHDWGAAAFEYARAAARAAHIGNPSDARHAWEAAGEAWRRDDRPRHAAEALTHTLALTPEGPRAAIARIKLAGVAGELGESDRVLALTADAVLALPTGPLHALALDTQFEALLAVGRRDDAADVARRLSALVANESVDPALAMAAAFREGQLARLDGRFDEAEERFGAVVAAVEGQDDALPARAAAEAELAEVAGFRGHSADALALWDRARQHFAAVGRRGLDWRAEAGRVRAAVEAGAMVLMGPLDEGIGAAEQRGMVVLEADLRIARGVGRAKTDRAGARQDLERAIAIADGVGHRWRAGRARLELARRIAEGEERIELARRSAEELAGNEPWRWRAIAVHGAAMLDAAADADAGQRLAVQALARFEVMGMERDADAVRAVIAS